jgi:hypothetical protein
MTIHALTSIDSDQLSTVCGGRDARDKIVLQQLEQKYGNDGVVSLIGHPLYGSTGVSGISNVSGRFDVNALWGGDTKRGFTGVLDHGTLRKLHTKVYSSE